MISRSLVGAGEAAFSCVATTLIGDLFIAKIRTQMIATFYLGMPIGIGLSYMVGSNISMYFDDWRWALRFTPLIGFICVILLLICVSEPQRGGAEGLINYENKKSSLLNDLNYLLKKYFYFNHFKICFY